MPYLTYGDYLYLDEIDDTPKSYLKLWNFQSNPDVTIMTPRTLSNKSLIQFPTMFVDQVLVP